MLHFTIFWIGFCVSCIFSSVHSFISSMKALDKEKEAFVKGYYEALEEKENERNKGE